MFAIPRLRFGLVFSVLRLGEQALFGDVPNHIRFCRRKRSIAALTACGCSSGAMCPACGIILNSALVTALEMACISAAGLIASLWPTINNAGQPMRGNSAVKSARWAMPRAAAAMPRGSVRSMTCFIFSDQMGLILQGDGGEKFGNHRIGQGIRSFTEDLFSNDQAIGGGLRRVGGGACVAEDQSPQTFEYLRQNSKAMYPPMDRPQSATGSRIV